MMKNVIFSLLFTLFASRAHAGTMACTLATARQIGNPGSTVGLSAGSCTFSNSYATGGDVFPGDGSDLDNAREALCGSGFMTLAAAIISSASTVSATTALFTAYNYSTGKLQSFYPTWITATVPTLTAPGTYTVSKPSFTIKKGAILAASELGLSADDVTGTINNNTIAVDLVLGAGSTPVGNQTISVTSDPTYSIAAAKRWATEVTAAVDLSAVTMHFTAICF